MEGATIAPFIFICVQKKREKVAKNISVGLIYSNKKGFLYDNKESLHH